MRIAIDARMLEPGSMHGIARYVYHLLDCLKDMGSSYEYYLVINDNSPLQKMTWPKNMHLVVTEAQWISFGEQWIMPRLLKKIKADLFHSPSFIAPLFCPCRLIMTIHDLNHLVLPQFYTPLHQFYYQIFVRSCIRRSEFILTVSHFSKQEIVRNLALPEEKIFVTYNGVSEHYHPVHDQEQLAYVRDLYELPEEFIFCLTNNKPHKNVHQLVRAYCHANIKIPLVLACPVDYQLIRIAENYGKKHLLYFAKFIAEEHLPSVYSMTKLFVYPSTYEGFGLPPLEAISCGAPVVVANSSSLPEVVGNNAIFANPFDFNDIAAALERGLSDQNLRMTLQKSGPQHAASFQWDVMTRQTLAIYERCQPTAHTSVAQAVS